MTLIDIILFCYNQEQYIEQALRTIYSQQLPGDVSVSIIVADDCSTDDTLAIVKRIAQESPFPINFLQKESNMGISKNYRRSFSATKADYVFVLEGDDYWLPNHVAQHMSFWQQYPNCSMAMNQITYVRVNKDGKETNEPVEKWGYSSNPFFVDLHKQIVEGNQLGNLSACSFRGDLLRMMPDSLYDIPVADWMLGVMMAEKAPIALLSGTSSIYRVKASGVWAGRSHWQQHKIMLREADIYDHFQNGKYHDEWCQFKQSLWQNVYRNWMHYMPQWVQDLWHRIKNSVKI